MDLSTPVQEAELEPVAEDRELLGRRLHELLSEGQTPEAMPAWEQLSEQVREARISAALRFGDIATANGAGLRWMLYQRGVESPCATCQGMGRRMYGSTATWRGGVGGARMTMDVCDVCWGSGCLENKGTDLRALRDKERARVKIESLEFFTQSAGVVMRSQHEAILMLCDELDKMPTAAMRKKGATSFFMYASRGLSKALREAVDAVKARNAAAEAEKK